jgi:hypothetical protein
VFEEAVLEPMAFRRLSFGFVVRCDDPALRAYISEVLCRFAVSDSVEGATTYEVQDLGPSETASRYRLLIDGIWVLGSGDPSHILSDLFSHVNVDTVEAAKEHVLIHAGAVVSPGGAGVVLPAPSGSGKTTLVAGLVRSGFGYLSDEAAVLDPETGTLYPYPVHLSVKGASRDRFPEGEPVALHVGFAGEAWQVDPEAIRAGAIAEPCEVGFVIAHRYEAGADLQIEPLTPAEACVALVGNLMLGRRDAPRSLDLLARICHASKSYRLTHGALDDAVEAISELTAG